MEEISRRGLLRSGMFATVGLFFSGAMGSAGAFLWPVKLTGFGSLVKAPVKLSELAVGDVVPVREGKFYLSRLDDGVMALYWKCVHLGCTVPWVEAEKRFVCPCHQSVYQPTGQNIAGPAPRPLDIMEVRIEGDDIYVDTGKIQQRFRHDLEHVTRV